MIPSSQEYSNDFKGVPKSLYISVQPTVLKLVLPPKANPAVCVPAPPKALLLVVKFPPDDHEVPSYFSVQPTRPPLPFEPPKANPSF